MNKIVSVDIGGTSIKGGLFIDDKLQRCYSVATNAEQGFAAIKRSLYEVVENLFDNGCEIAICSAGDIDAREGECVYATPNLPGFTGYKIATDISARYGTVCRVINDGHAALLGEMKFGTGRSKNSGIMLTLGTGVGGAYFKNEKIQFGENYNAYRFGHYELVNNGKKCNCGKCGCIEQYVSASALNAMINEKNAPYKCTKALFENSQDIVAEEILGEYFSHLSDVITLLEQDLSPDVIILGGGITSSSVIFKKYIKNPIVELAQLKNRAGIFGAKYFLENYNTFFPI